MLLVPDETIEVIALPKAAGAPDQRIDLPRRETLPTSDELFQRPFWILHEKGMRVIRHDHRGNHDHALTFKMPQSFRYDLSALRSSQKTGAMTYIEPALDRA